MAGNVVPLVSEAGRAHSRKKVGIIPAYRGLCKKCHFSDPTQKTILDNFLLWKFSKMSQLAQKLVSLTVLCQFSLKPLLIMTQSSPLGGLLLLGSPCAISTK